METKSRIGIEEVLTLQKKFKNKNLNIHKKL